jgi:ABC-type multidrug transport system fused ATPase/permease subunit
VIGAIRRALSLLDRADRVRWLSLVPLAVGVAVLEAAGAGSVFLLVRMVAAPGQAAALPRVVRWLPVANNRPATLTFAAAVVVLYLLRNVLLVGVELVQDRVIQRSASRIAIDLLARYLHAPYAFHFRRSSSSLIHAVRHGVDAVVELVLASAVNIASECLVAAGLLTLLAIAAPVETLAAVATILVLIVGPLGVTRRLYARWGGEERRLDEEMITGLQQSLDTVKQVLVSGRQPFFVERYAHARRALRHAKLRRTLTSTSLRLGVETVFICAMLIAVAMLSVAGRSGPDAVSVLSLFAYAGFRVVPSANRIILNVNLLRYGRPFVDALVGDWRALDPQPARPLILLPPLARQIECDRVSYFYDGGAAPALHDVSFVIPCGTSVGVVGPTGAGKSTMVDVVLGLLTPTSGRVLVDGHDIREALAAWQAQIGYVPQEVALVDDSLRRNVAFGIHDPEIDDGRVRAAVEDARLAALVSTWPDGLATRIGERGVRLSGGERQRLAIARALYRQPQVLVFDEATSALDPQTEREVTDAIDAVRGTTTVIVIAHRLTTVRECDRILLIDGGRLVAQGRYGELLESSALFRALATAGARD